MYFNNTILLNPIQNTMRPMARRLKIYMNTTIYGTYLRTKLQNIDLVEHLHLKSLGESLKIGVFLLIFFFVSS